MKVLKNPIKLNSYEWEPSKIDPHLKFIAESKFILIFISLHIILKIIDFLAAKNLTAKQSNV